MSKTTIAIAIAAATATLAVAPAMARDLNAVTSLQQTNTIARSFITTFVGAVNNAKGPVKINYVGGQEVVPPRKAANALKRGQFDVLCSPTAYYIGTVPEGYALLAANQGPAALRKSGAWEILQEVYAKKAGAHLLAWGENMTSYNMYLAKKPKMKDGIPDLTGVKMRATGTYRPLFRALGGSTINIKSSEIFTAMQRGTVEGFGFTDVSFVPLGFHQVAKYYYYPGWHEPGPTLELIVNKDAYAMLPKDLQTIVEVAARAVNQDMLDEYTARNNEALVTLVETHGVQLRKLPDEVVSELRGISAEMLEELADDSDIARRIAESVKAFQRQATAYHAISEEAYYEARKE